MRSLILGILSSVLIAFLTMFLFVNCSSNGADSPVAKASPLELLSTSPYNFISQNYEIKNYKLNSSDGAVYFQVIPGCSDLCPVVVVSMPYNGIPWTNDAADLRWSTHFPSGALTDDVDGPNFVVGSGQQIAFYQSSISTTVGFGAIFLPSKVTAVLVYNRFYLGRKMDNYVNDFVSVVNELNRFSYIDTSKMGFLGSSLGGFVTTHASRKTSVKPLAVVGITPLLNLKSEQTEMSTVSARITANPTSLLASQNFYNSYLRRMASVDVNNYTSQVLANENTTSKILVIHDTWDTIVSIDQYTAFKAQRSLDSFIFQHATPIDYNTFTMGHSQNSEGYTNDKILPIYTSYLLNRLKATSDPKIIYYTSPEFVTGISEIKAAQDRGQTISWFKNFIEDLCTPGFSLIDYSPTGNLGTLTGIQMAGGIIANVWGKPTTVDNGCTYLQGNPNIFN